MDQIKEVLYGINHFMQNAPKEFNYEIYNRGHVEGNSEMYLKVCYSFYMSQKKLSLLLILFEPLEILPNLHVIGSHMFMHDRFYCNFIYIIFILYRIKKFSTQKALITVDTMLSQDQSILVT